MIDVVNKPYKRHNPKKIPVKHLIYHEFLTDEYGNWIYPRYFEWIEGKLYEYEYI